MSKTKRAQKLLVAINSSGEIESAVWENADSKYRTGIEPHPGQTMAEVEPPPNSEDVPLHEFARIYKVDIHTRRLVPKADEPQG